MAGDYDKHLEKTRDWEFFKATNCGKFWTQEECLEQFGARAYELYNQLECETQVLSQGRRTVWS